MLELSLQTQPYPYASRKSLTSIGVAVVVHVAIGYLIVSGLAKDVIKVISKPIETRIIEEIKPPPPANKPEPPPKVVKPKQATVPPPEVKVDIAPPPTAITVEQAPVVPSPPVVSAAPPAPAAPAQPAIAKVGLACPNSTAIRQSLEYPRRALQNNISGSVLVQFVVAANGHSRDFTLLKSAHPLLNRAALDAAQRFNCVGQGQDVVVQVPFEFKVE